MLPHTHKTSGERDEEVTKGIRSLF